MCVASADSSVHSYVVSIGNGPSAVRITRRRFGIHSTISYVYSRRRPRNFATNATRAPVRNIETPFHSTAVMFLYQRGAFSGFAAKAATSDMGRSIVIEDETSIPAIVPAPRVEVGSNFTPLWWRLHGSCEGQTGR